jgi:hypothetical protein
MSVFDNPFDPAREAALVTGAGNGIGRAIAHALVGQGVRTVFADVSADRVANAIEAAPRGRSCLRRGCRNLGGDALGQCRRGVLFVTRTRSTAHRSQDAWLLFDADVTPRWHTAQSAALQYVQGGTLDAGEGVGKDIWSLRHPDQRTRSRRNRRRRICRGRLARPSHPARSYWQCRGPGADGSRGAFKPDIRLCNRSQFCGGRRLVPDELVRPSCSGLPVSAVAGRKTTH